MSGLAAAVCLAGAVCLGAPPRPRLPGHPPRAGRADVGTDRILRYRWLWSLLAGVGALTFLGGVAGLVGLPVAATVTWVVVGRSEPPGERRRREAVRRELPHVVALVAAALRAGADPVEAVGAVCRALPGPTADALAGVSARLELGSDPVMAWAAVSDDPDLGPLGRAMVRAHRTGAPIVQVVDRLAVELARAGRATVEERARAVGVKAAVPLGLCLLPAFVLIGIVPLVAGLLSSLAW